MRIGIDCRKIADYGIGTYVRGLVHGLAEIDAPEEYVLFAPSRFLGELPSRFERLAADVPNYSIREQFVMRRLIDTARLDLFHSAHYVLPLTPCRKVATIHDVILFHFPPDRLAARLYAGFMTQRASHISQRIATVSEAAKEAIATALRCDPDRIHVTPNGIASRFFEPRDRERDPRQILFVGNDKPHKNLDLLVHAFRQVRAIHPAARLILCGAPFERFGAVDGVELAGFVDDRQLEELYRSSAVLVMPSLEEGFGLPAAEAMACGTAVLTSDTPALMEVTGDAALHVDARSAPGFAAALLRLLADEPLRRELGERGRTRACQFTWKRCAEATRAMYLAALHD